MTLTIGDNSYGLSQIVNMTDGEILDLVYDIQASTDSDFVARVLTQTLLEWARNEAKL